MQKTQLQSLAPEDPLEKGNVNPLRVLAWLNIRRSPLSMVAFPWFWSELQSWPKNMKLKIPEITKYALNCIIRSSIIKPCAFLPIPPGIPKCQHLLLTTNHQHCHGSMVQDYQSRWFSVWCTVRRSVIRPNSTSPWLCHSFTLSHHVGILSSHITTRRVNIVQ